MHSSRSIEPMSQRQKFREGAKPISKKRRHHMEESEQFDNDASVPFWSEHTENDPFWNINTETDSQVEEKNV